VLLTFPRQRERKRALSTLGGVGKGKIRKGVPYHAIIAKRKPMIKTLIYWFQRSEFKFSRKQFKVDRLQIIVVAKKYIYVSQLFISRMPKMRAIPQLVSIIAYMDFSTEVFFSCYLRVIGNFMIGDAIELTLLFSTSMGVGNKILLGKILLKHIHQIQSKQMPR